MGDDKKCSACGETIDNRRDGIELWGAWFCSKCFISNAAKTHKELTPDDILLLRRIGRELAGFLPQDLLEMVLAGFHKRTRESLQPGELARCVGEIQRLAAFACFRQIMSLLKNWKSMFDDFVEQEETEIRSKIRQLTDFDADKP
jgi:hypothetical protein